MPRKRTAAKLPQPELEDQEEGSSSNSDHETTPDDREDSVMTDSNLDNQIATIMQGMQLEQEADSDSGSELEYEESEQGLRDQATKAIKELRLGSAREKAEIHKLDENRTAIRDTVMEQVKQLEDCGQDAERTLYAAFKIRLDDVTANSTLTSPSEKKMDGTDTEAPKVDDCVVKWDPADPVHKSIGRLSGMTRTSRFLKSLKES
ncbi:hypothetical protein BGZ82_003691 [Podila clonocystis]|nr:hypothetical protein BGZ82_003691 [Podila clonocystis]